MRNHDIEVGGGDRPQAGAGIGLDAGITEIEQGGHQQLRHRQGFEVALEIQAQARRQIGAGQDAADRDLARGGAQACRIGLRPVERDAGILQRGGETMGRRQAIVWQKDRATRLMGKNRSESLAQARAAQDAATLMEEDQQRRVRRDTGRADQQPAHRRRVACGRNGAVANRLVLDLDAGRRAQQGGRLLPFLARGFQAAVAQAQRCTSRCPVEPCSPQELYLGVQGAAVGIDDPAAGQGTQHGHWQGQHFL